MKKPEVSIIIPNWNGVELLNICLSSISRQTFRDFEVIVIDNGSSDSSVNYVRKNYSAFKIITFQKNLGFAKAVNKGIEKARGEYIFLLNNDTEIEKDCLKYLVKASLEHPEVGMVATKILNYLKRNVIDNTGDTIDAVGHLYSRGFKKKDGKIFNNSCYIFAVSGGGGFFRKDVFKKVGCFDEDYFFYMEDIDLGLRAQLAGFKAWYEPRALIYHMRMATSSKNMGFVEPECFRNMTMTIIKDFPLKLFLHNNNWIKIILVNLNTVKYLAGKGYLRGALKAEWFILTHIKKLLEKRKKVQSLKIVSDQYIIENVQEKKLRIPLTRIMF